MAVQHKNRTLQKLHELEHKIYALHHFDTQSGHVGDIIQLCKQLEADMNKILLADEALWRQRSRVNWIKCGDLNTKKNHCFPNSSKNKKHIWDITDETGTKHSGQQEIKTTTTNYYKSFYEARAKHTFKHKF